MKKKIRQVTGTQVGITFTKEERDTHGMDVGDVINLEDMIIIKQKEAEENLRDCMAKTQNARRIKEIKRRLKR